MPIQFNASSDYTLGVEIELGVIDRNSMELVPRAADILSQVPEKWTDCVKPEFMQGYLEFNTGVCDTVDDVRKDLQEKLKVGLWPCRRTRCDLSLERHAPLLTVG